MIRRSLYLLAAVACLAAAPAIAQEPAAQAPVPRPAAAQAARGGPRLDTGFRSYRPSLVQEHEASAAAAAADRTVITISTLGVILLAVLLILLLT